MGTARSHGTQPAEDRISGSGQPRPEDAGGLYGPALQRLEDVEDAEGRARFLAAARLDNLDLHCDLRPLPADGLCTRVPDKYEDVLEQAGVILDVSAGTRAALLADENLLWSVLDNLIYNALRYTPPGGTIRADCAPKGGARFTLTFSAEAKN